MRENEGTECSEMDVSAKKNVEEKEKLNKEVEEKVTAVHPAVVLRVCRSRLCS